jgi:argininosuccinate lyase
MPSREIIEFLSGRDVKGLPPSDERLIPYDLWGSRAHVLMLYRQSILSRQDARKILKGLKALETLHRRGEFRLDPAKEDVHSNIESFLIERLGIDHGGKVHTGRSRNDQVTLGMRLYLRDQVLEFAEGLISLIETLLKRGEEYRSTLMPGYTHHQHAVPTTFGHLLLSFAEALQRDVGRFVHWFDLFNKNPLGAAAGYGSSFNLDRDLTSRLLGFDGPTENVTDPITQRWEPEAELSYAVAVMMDHLSTMAQTLILLSTHEFNMVRLADRHCTGSSMMPQKRNPCSLEVIKAKASFTQGVMMSLLSTGKALFMGYNRDTQWTKYWVMDLVDESKPTLFILRDVVQLLRADETRMLERAQEEFSDATPVMEWIARSYRLPLRKAKLAVEKAVKYSEQEGMGKLSYQSLKRALDEMKIRAVFSRKEMEAAQRPENLLAQNLSVGAPSEKRIGQNIVSLRKRNKANRDWVLHKKKALERAKGLLSRMEKQIVS